jgi:type 1 glutamine amidotransferase
MKMKGSAPLLAGACAAALVGASLTSVKAQQTPAAPAAAGAPAQGGGAGARGGGGLNDPCGGRSPNPKEACPDDVNKMMATVGLLPDKPPATPQKARKVLAYSRIPSSGFQHSSIPLAMKTIEALGKKTGAWTTDWAWDPSAFTAANLNQYDAIFLSSTTGTFLDDPTDQAVTDARRKALLDFVRSGKGIAGIHATGDSYHGGGGRGRAAVPGAPGAPAAPAAPAAAGTAAGAGRVGGRAAGGGQTFAPCGNPQPAAAAATMPGTAPAGNQGGGQGLWPEWNKMIGGWFKFHWVYPTPITVHIDDPSNPINAAFKGHDFDTIDEVYTFNQDSWSRSNVHVLTSIDYTKMSDCDKGKESSPRTDHDFGLSWIRREGQGRVFYEALGHHESIYYNNPAILAHVLAGMQYALGDLKADDSPSVKAK